MRKRMQKKKKAIFQIFVKTVVTYQLQHRIHLYFHNRLQGVTVMVNELNELRIITKRPWQKYTMAIY